MIEMKVAGIAIDAANRSPIVLLKDGTDRRALPIYINQDQAKAIIGALENQKPPRPLTHDLLVNILEVWDMVVERIVIHSIQEGTFYAILTVRQGEVKKEIDARPSDAIAIALRTADEAEQRAFREFLSNLRPEDFVQGGDFSTGEA